MAATFDMDVISDVLSIETADATNADDDDVTLTFSAITETTTQTISIDASSMTGGGDLAVSNSSGIATTTFSIVGSGGVDTIAGGIGNDTISGGAGVDVVTSGAGNDSITGGAGADSITGGTGADQIILTDTDNAVDIVTYTTGASNTLVTIAGTGDSGTISGFDSVTGFNAGATGAEKDQIKYGVEATLAAGDQDSLTTASTLTVGGATLKSLSASATGLTTFDDAATHATGVTLVGQGGLAAAAQTLINNDLGDAGDTFAFVVTGTDGFEGSYVYQQNTANSGATTGDAYSLTRLEGITTVGLELAAADAANLIFVD
jgi:Ca2+-binding RTX toxin-like protein